MGRLVVLPQDSWRLGFSGLQWAFRLASHLERRIILCQNNAIDTVGDAPSGFCRPHLSDVNVQSVDAAAASTHDADEISPGEHEYPENPYSATSHNSLRLIDDCQTWPQDAV